MTAILKHLKKLIPCLSIGALIAPIMTIASCSKSNFVELNLTEQQNYIADRTFSIIGRNDIRSVLGTGWIISDATKDNTNDYQYWLATNWHVTKGMEDIAANSYYYADSSLKTTKSYIEHTDYALFPDKGFQIVEPTTNFIYNDGLIGQYLISAIDLSVVKVNFGSPTGTIKTKLDKLNECQKKNGYINKFAVDSDQIRAKNKIIGGYPKKGDNSSYGGQWETHSFASSNCNYCAKYQKYDGINCGHAIGNPKYDQRGIAIEGGEEEFYYYDVSPQYMFKTKMSKDFMSGGASGSMMITQDYEVCGIYWGGWETDNDFYPSFSLFNTDEINFLEKYI